VLGQAYLVPFNNRKTNQKEAQLQIGYRGYITLARRSGEVSNVYSELVFDCDFFHVELGTEKQLKHIPNYEAAERGQVNEDTGELVGLKGAYAVVKYKDGDTDFEYMPLFELDRIRFSSKAADNGPWVTHPAEMYKKCPIRRLAKRLPLSPELMKAAVHDEHVDAGVASPAAAEIIDVEEPIFQDTQSTVIADKGAQTLNGIKQKYLHPQQPQPEQTEPSNAEAAEQPTTAAVKAQARQVQAKIDARRKPPTTMTSAGEVLRESGSVATGDEEQW
jgi:recombinational DNA repair protein RecT